MLGDRTTRYSHRVYKQRITCPSCLVWWRVWWGISRIQSRGRSKSASICLLSRARWVQRVRSFPASLSMKLIERGIDAAAATSNFVYKSRARNEPTNVTMPQWSLVMWSRLEGLMSALGTICIRVYTLEKVLKLKKDPSTQGSFFDEVMTVSYFRRSGLGKD